MNLRCIIWATTVCCVAVELTNCSVTTQWSQWNNCSSKSSSCVSRSLICRTPDNVESPCRHGNRSVEEELYNCTNCNGTWVLRENGSCISSCYNTSRSETEICSTNSFCTRRSKIPCNNLTLCEGKWEIKQLSQCNTTCENVGKQSVISECLRNNQPSVECSGSFGLMKRMTTVQSCFNKNCNLWSGWLDGSCSRSCGGGYINRTRTCLNTSNCSVPKNNDVITELCNNQSCPSWSAWITSSVCLGSQQVKSRACLYLGALNDACEGESSTAIETELVPCNQSTNQTIYDNCDQLLFTFTIPLIVGIFFVFLFFLIIAILLIRRSHKTKKNKQLYNHDMSDKQISTCLTATPNYTSATAESKFTFEDKLNQLTITEPIFKNSSCPILDMHESDNDNINLNDKNSVKDNRFVEFHRAESFPNIVNEDEVEAGKTSNEPPLKPRPSVRRAERMRLREERREKRLVKRNEDLTWRRTQTLRQTRNQLKDQSAQSNPLSRHKRAQSFGGVVKVDLSYPPVKPLRKSLRNLNKSQTSFTNKTLAKPVKPRRHSNFNSPMLPLIVQKGSNNPKLVISSSTEDQRLQRSLSEGDMTSIESRSSNKKRANSTRKFTQPGKEITLHKETEYRGNPRFKRERSVDASSFRSQFPRFLHPKSTSSLLAPQNPAFMSSRSLQSVDELADFTTFNNPS